jgi:predicted transcriptional regulator
MTDRRSGHGGKGHLRSAAVCCISVAWSAMPREKAQAAETARPKVPMRRSGADCSVVVMKRGNARGGKGAGHRRRERANWHDVHGALATVGQAPTEAIKAVPAVDLMKSVFADHILCLDCGQSFEMLKRHISTDHGTTPDEYRIKWGLPASYPMVAAAYAAERSKLAIASGLGRKVEAPPPPPKKGGRLRKRK